jgi:ribosomal protein S18 acetylase RimI-like enzyme
MAKVASKPFPSARPVISSSFDNIMAPKPIDIVALDIEGFHRHLDALAEILHACVHDGASVSFVLPFEISHARAFWLNKVAPGLIADTRIVLIARIDGEVAGTVQLDLDTPPNQAHRADVAKLLVHPKFRQSGIGRALMQHVEDHSENAGRWLLTLDTRTGDTAEPLYVSLGYERVGCIPDYAQDPFSDRFDATTIMFKRLKSAAMRTAKS